MDCPPVTPVIIIILGLHQRDVVAEGLGNILGETNLGPPIVIKGAPAETADVVIVIEPEVLISGYRKEVTIGLAGQEGAVTEAVVPIQFGALRKIVAATGLREGGITLVSQLRVTTQAEFPIGAHGSHLDVAADAGMAGNGQD